MEKAEAKLPANFVCLFDFAALDFTDAETLELAILKLLCHGRISGSSGTNCWDYRVFDNSGRSLHSSPRPYLFNRLNSETLAAFGDWFQNIKDQHTNQRPNETAAATALCFQRAFVELLGYSWPTPEADSDDAQSGHESETSKNTAIFLFSTIPNSQQSWKTLCGTSQIAANKFSKAIFGSGAQSVGSKLIEELRVPIYWVQCGSVENLQIAKVVDEALRKSGGCLLPLTRLLDDFCAIDIDPNGSQKCCPLKAALSCHFDFDTIWKLPSLSRVACQLPLYKGMIIILGMVSEARLQNRTFTEPSLKFRRTSNRNFNKVSSSLNRRFLCAESKFEQDSNQASVVYCTLHMNFAFIVHSLKGVYVNSLLSNFRRGSIQMTRFGDCPLFFCTLDSHFNDF